MQPAELSPRAQQLVAKMVGENIDRLMSMELRACGLVPQLYAAAREQVGFPLSMAAAMLLRERVTRGSTVIILTGFPILPTGVPETDGTVGAAALARAVNVAFDALPVLVAEEEFLGAMRATLRASGLNVFDAPGQVQGLRSAVVAPFTKDDAAARRDAVALVDGVQPTAVIAVERVGWNRARVHHTSRGIPLSHLVAKLDHIFEVARERGLATVGIGDVGNELGLGSLQAVVARATVAGGKCVCPCGAGMACAVPADVPVVAGVSDWGAYGVIAALAYLLGEPDVLHAPFFEVEMLRACVAAGAIDAPTGRPIPWIDGIETGYHVRLIDQLHDVIRAPGRLYRMDPSLFEKNAEIDPVLSPGILRNT